MIEALGLRALRAFDPETAHGLALKALNAGLGPKPGPVTSQRLKCTIAGLEFPNPVGLAAGFDKNATALAALSKVGFGFLEVGAATPLPQPGNPKPRLFRLTEDRAAINRFGFNNDGADVIADRLMAHNPTIPVGLNLGANKTSTDRAGDFARVIATCGPYVDFATVNVSSPNTEKLRDLQGRAALTALLTGALEARDALPKRIPLFLKIAPDLSPAELEDIAEVATSLKLDGIITTNTTLDRTGLQSPHAGEAGGLSGAPLFERATRVLAQMSKLTDGQMPLIGVGGVRDADTAYAKICAGATAVQLYTALVYAGPSLIADIALGLDARMRADGHTTLEQAVGSRRSDWL